MGLLQLAPKMFLTCKSKTIPEWNLTNSPVSSLTKWKCKLREERNANTQRVYNLINIAFWPDLECFKNKSGEVT